MGLGNSFKSKRSSDTVIGAVIGLVAGLGFTIISWIMAGTIKVLLTWDIGIWPEWFPGYIPDFILSRLWAVIIILTFTVGGAIAGSLLRRRLKSI